MMLKPPALLFPATAAASFCSPLRGIPVSTLVSVNTANLATATTPCLAITMTPPPCTPGQYRFWACTEDIPSPRATRKPFSFRTERADASIGRFNEIMIEVQQGRYARIEELVPVVKEVVNKMDSLGKTNFDARNLRRLSEELSRIRRSGVLDRAQQKAVADIEVFLEQEFHFKSGVSKRLEECRGTSKFIDGQYYDQAIGSATDRRRFMQDPKFTANRIQQRTFRKDDLEKQFLEKKGEKKG